MIDVTNVDKVELIKKAYEISRPQGAGFIYISKRPLTDKDAKSHIRSDGTFCLDYVRGRSCKLSLFKKNNKFYIHTPWPNHMDGQLVQLLKHVGIDYKPRQEEHNICCNCDSCRKKRGDVPLNPLTGM